ncbi:hypothetical protein AC622_03175 [Bacillus sp. FJAT-27916]|uniref:recombinase family protein n=1 Tax=Bacillus sp. FJAT-27916 TaxID=1679169 RepID=UPI00067103BE|nr:recombinase family protein [Bacillus sp. FJAT-27916]KMY43379.1 hypothetical protein AC622_03175 [Bacillus sp. FJAT-27916]
MKQSNAMQITGYKKVAHYLRTSSSGQELKLQRGTNEKYLKDVPEDNVIEFVDFDVSATKLCMDERPALSRMLKLIQEGGVSTVVVYERDRLARDVYEYIRIVTTIHHHNVDVVFTASEAPPFSNDLLMEVWYGLSAQFEGQRIRTRLADARKRNPSSLIGYNKVKATKSSSAKYIAKKEYKEKIYQLFFSFSEANTKEDIYNIIKEHKSFLKRTDTRIIEILQNPFFCGHTVTSSGIYEVLENVEPMVTVELFKKVQNKIEQFDREINKGMVLSQQQSVIKPYCGICDKELKFNKGVIGAPGHYTCSKHKVSIGLFELMNDIKESLGIVFQRISSSKIKKITVNKTNKHLAELKKCSKQIQAEIEELCLDFVLDYTPQELSSSEKNIKEINDLRDNLNQIVNKINLIEERLSDIRFVQEISQLDFNEVIEMEFNTLVEILISKINVHPEYIQFDYYFNEYLKEGDVENAS